MNATQIVNSLKNHKGQHVLACWARDVKTLKTITARVTKKTCAYVRAGIDYANLASVRDGIESGERSEVGALKWGEWTTFPFIISHKGVDYVRLYPSVFANLPMTTEFFIDGVAATPEQVRPMCLASEFRERDEEVLCFTLRAESLVSIG